MPIVKRPQSATAISSSTKISRIAGTSTPQPGTMSNANNATTTNATTSTSFADDTSRLKSSATTTSQQKKHVQLVTDSTNSNSTSNQLLLSSTGTPSMKKIMMNRVRAEKEAASKKSSSMNKTKPVMKGSKINEQRNVADRQEQSELNNNNTGNDEENNTNDNDDDENNSTKNPLFEFLQQHQHRQQLQEEQQQLISYANNLSFIQSQQQRSKNDGSKSTPSRHHQHSSYHHSPSSPNSTGSPATVMSSMTNDDIDNNNNDNDNNTNAQNDNSTTNSGTQNDNATTTMMTSTSLVQQKLHSAKDRFFAHARDQMRNRQIQRDGVFNHHPGSGVDHETTNTNTNTSSDNRNFSFGGTTSMSASSGATTLGGVTNATTFAMKFENAEKRAAVVKNVLATSSVFNVNSSVGEIEHKRKNHNIIDNSNGALVVANNNDTNNDDDETILRFPGFQGKATHLAIFSGNSEPMTQHIDRVRENALLAALEASRSRTANETRQADAAAKLQSFFRMVVVRRRYVRQKLNVAKQLRTIDRLRCCKAAMMLSRFCRGHNVRKYYRLQRADIAARRLDNLTRRSKIERPQTPGLQRVPPTSLVENENCTSDEWTQDVLARFNVNFVNGVRAMMGEGNYLEAIIFFENHIKTSTVSAKEQSNEYLAEILIKKATSHLPGHVQNELLAKQGNKGRRRF